jgi:uncharacterized membrane protein YbhN (UPF0104 family)
MLQMFVFLVMAFFPTPGAAIGAEATFLLFFSSIVPSQTAAVIIIGWRFLTFYYPLAVGALLFLFLNLFSLFKEKLSKSPSLSTANF